MKTEEGMERKRETESSVWLNKQEENTFKVTAGGKKEEMRRKGDRLIERRRGRCRRSWKVLMRTAKKKKKEKSFHWFPRPGLHAERVGQQNGIRI